MLPDKDRAELLNDRIIYKASPSIEHGGAAADVIGQLLRFQGPPGGGRPGGWWLSQEVDLYLSGQGLRPDLVGWRVDRHPRPPKKVNVGNTRMGVYVTPPDWVCEILSPATRAQDEVEGIKWNAYFEAGLEHYWLVDVQRMQITVYQRGERSFSPVAVVGRDDVRRLPPFEAVEFESKWVFLIADFVSRQP